MIVVDTNIVASLFLSSEQSEMAESVLRRDPEWVAPALWRSEFRNVLATYMKSGRLDLADAVVIMGKALLLMNGREYELPSPGVLAIASESGCSAYDCEFVALARELNVPLVTLDGRLLQSFPNDTVSLDRFVA